jgi:hypothetical protein
MGNGKVTMSISIEGGIKIGHLSCAGRQTITTFARQARRAARHDRRDVSLSVRVGHAGRMHTATITAAYAE